MKTKEEYEKALKEINDAFYGANFLNNQTRRFDGNLNLLRELVNEHFEEKKETNFEHYKDVIIKLCIDELAVSKGKVVKCCAIPCSECDFNDKNGHCICNPEIMKWLKQPYRKPPYKLSKFEFDIIQTYRDCHESCKFSEFKQFIELKGKGYFKGIDLDLKIHEILANCEVVRYISLQDFS